MLLVFLKKVLFCPFTTLLDLHLIEKKFQKRSAEGCFNSSFRSAPQHCVINKKDQQAHFMNLMIDSSAQALLVLPRVVEPMEHRFYGVILRQNHPLAFSK